MPADATLGLEKQTTFFMAEIKPCNIDRSHHELDIHYYNSYMTPVVLEITNIECLVGRVKTADGDWWAVIDRSGTLSRAEWVPEE